MTAIIVDGSDQPQVGGVAVMPAQRVGRGGGRFAGVGIGVLAAIVAVGATGPKSEVAAPGETAAPVLRLAGATWEGVPPHPARGRSSEPAWREWVDPKTGMTVRVFLGTAPQRTVRRPVPKGPGW